MMGASPTDREGNKRPAPNAADGVADSVVRQLHAELVALLKRFNADYEAGHPQISDAFYDEIADATRALERRYPDLDPFALKTTGSPPEKGRKTSWHDVPMQSLDSVTEGRETRPQTHWAFDARARKELEISKRLKESLKELAELAMPKEKLEPLGKKLKEVKESLEEWEGLKGKLEGMGELEEKRKEQEEWERRDQPELLEKREPDGEPRSVSLKNEKSLHGVPMQSLDSVTEAQTEETLLGRFVWRVLEELETQLQGEQSIRWVPEPKIDGLALRLTYGQGILVDAALRGDGLRGHSVLPHVQLMDAIPKRLLGQSAPPMLEIQGEVFYPLSAFRRDFPDQEEGANVSARNTAAGIMRWTTDKLADRESLPLLFRPYGVGQGKLDFGLKTQTQLQGWFRDNGFVVEPTYEAVGVSVRFRPSILNWVLTYNRAGKLSKARPRGWNRNVLPQAQRIPSIPQGISDSCPREISGWVRASAQEDGQGHSFEAKGRGSVHAQATKIVLQTQANLNEMSRLPLVFCSHETDLDTRKQLEDNGFVVESDGESEEERESARRNASDREAGVDVDLAQGDKETNRAYRERVLKLFQEKLTSAFHQVKQERDRWDFEADGVVFKIDNMIHQEMIGRSDRAPLWSFAYKFAGRWATTTARQIRWQTSAFGFLTPLVEFDPVKIDGRTFTKASAHNADHLASLRVRLAEILTVSLAGGVIPQILPPSNDPPECSDGDEFAHEPCECPDCGGPVGRSSRLVVLGDGKSSGTVWHCQQPERCPAVIRGAIQTLAKHSALDIANLGPGLISQLWEEKLISRPSDIFGLRREALLALDGVKEKSATSLLEGLERARTTTLSRFLLGLVLPSLGEDTAVLLSQLFVCWQRLRSALLPSLETLEPQIEWMADQSVKKDASGRASKSDKKIGQATATKLLKTLSLDFQRMQVQEISSCLTILPCGLWIDPSVSGKEERRKAQLEWQELGGLVIEDPQQADLADIVVLPQVGSRSRIFSPEQFFSHVRTCQAVRQSMEASGHESAPMIV